MWRNFNNFLWCFHTHCRFLNEKLKLKNFHSSSFFCQQQQTIIIIKETRKKKKIKIESILVGKIFKKIVFSLQKNIICEDISEKMFIFNYSTKHFRLCSLILMTKLSLYLINRQNVFTEGTQKQQKNRKFCFRLISSSRTTHRGKEILAKGTALNNFLIFFPCWKSLNLGYTAKTNSNVNFVISISSLKFTESWQIKNFRDFFISFHSNCQVQKCMNSSIHFDKILPINRNYNNFPTKNWIHFEILPNFNRKCFSSNFL